MTVASSRPPTLPTSRVECAALDRSDPLRALRDEFVLPEGVVYLDGNSLGALPRRTAARLAEVAAHEWGEGLIRSWNAAGWIDLPQRIGDKIATLIGAGGGEVTVADSTSLNVFKTLSAAVALHRADASARSTILSERGNFPTDVYIAESVAATAGMFTVAQEGVKLRIASSAVDIERDPDWTNHRDFWKQRTGTPLTRVFYRGEGLIRGDEDDVVAADAPPGPKRILVSVRVDPPEGGEAIDTGALRGAIDPDGNRIRGRLWLNSEQAERVVDLRREP